MSIPDEQQAARLQAQFYTGLAPALGEWLRGVAAEQARAGVPLHLVGGPVRDLLLGRPPLDLDLVLVGDAPALARRLGAAQGWRVTAHAAFGTATLHLQPPLAPPPPAAPTIDLITARRETYPQPGKLPQVTPADMSADLARRDFTINALALRLDPAKPTLLDPHGGQADIAAGIIRALHPASFHDDPTRIFRAARYAARFGFAVEPATRVWIAEALAAEGLDRLSPARLWHELARTLAEPDSAPALARLAAWGALAAVDPDLRWTEELAADLRCAPDASGRLAIWLARLPKGVQSRIAARLGQTGGLAAELAALAALGPSLAGGDAVAVTAALRPFPVASVALARCLAPAPVAAVLGRYLDEWQHITPLLTGTDLRALGLPPGPAYRPLLAALLQARLAGQVQTRADEIAFVQAWVARHS
jgi:tRNA nucleotidyltransferase (CCA-adding enzyme)